MARMKSAREWKKYWCHFCQPASNPLQATEEPRNLLREDLVLSFAFTKQGFLLY